MSASTSKALPRALCDAFLPQTCVICGEWIATGTGSACRGCRQELREITRRSYCPRCGRSMPATAIKERHCARCRTERFWNIAGLARIGAYESPLRQLGARLKYHGRARNANFAARLLARALRKKAWLCEVEALVPVPMHWLRRQQRPVEHTDLLTTALGRGLDLPVWRVVRRVKYTPSQTQVTSQARRFANIDGCFACAGGVSEQLKGRCVCIIDNLLASGATICEVSKVLRRAGARRIYAAVISRTVLAGDMQAGPGM
ncbi:MAG: double zinc ribbon domain-containing protein [Planctomycetota bacterium]